ncbi:hypothetical protein BKA64DRAFT_211816 [Cadophora sp. MPI-SDFR-AT-0126]|nr:hypothetical protein BKA64DRAFT_211816 [Leotiomycetes sp. MPI-SDFR-AT-0126]
MAFLKTPEDAPQFFACFPNWPADSLEHRTDIEAGSKWGLREIGSFKLLRQSRGLRFPVFLEDDAAEAIRRVEESQDIQTAVNLLISDWQRHNRSELLRLAGIFAPFFSLLAEVLEQPPTPNPDRYFRRADDAPDALPEVVGQSSQSSSFSAPLSSPLEPPAKRFRETHSADSYHPSHQSDQSTYDRQIKSEFTTNACAFYFLQCVTESTRNDGDRASFRLEWALTQDTFTVETPRGQFSSTNDGNLVYRDGSSGEKTHKSLVLLCRG